MREVSLSDLRARAHSLASENALRKLARALGGDDRAGARALAERCRLRARGLGRERRRQNALDAIRQELLAGGVQYVAGVDEVGVGPLAGPVVAAAVVLPSRHWLPGLDDSKRVRRPDRERLAAAIRVQAVGISIAEVWPDEIDRLNIYRATLEAMRRAVVASKPTPDHVLVDARTIPGLDMPQTPLVRGDTRDASIAAASIVAKVHRDAIMQRLDREHPGYGFARHKGYGTGEHLTALRRRGPSSVHPRSSAPVAQQVLF